MKGVPEEAEEDDEGEVWSSRTDPVPQLPPSILKPSADEDPDLDPDDPDAYWDPDDFAGIPRPPDGGWGWVIVAASFFCNMVVDGIGYSFGIFLIHFVQYYQSAKGETAWIGSLLTGCYLLAGPMVSALTNKFGCRPVTMAGSAISGVAFLLSTVAPNVRVMMFTYGIMGGVGFGLIYLPAIVSVGYYFSTKRAFATGIAVCGSGMGAFVFAPITQMLLDTYDWKGALVILAGLSLNCMVFGSLMRPLKAEPRRKKGEQSQPLLQDSKEELEKDRTDSGLVLVGEESTMKSPFLNTEPGVQSTLNINEVGAKSVELPKLGPHLTDEMHSSVDVVPAVGLIVTTESSGQQLSTVTHLSQANKLITAPQEDTQNSSLGTLKGAAQPNKPNGAIKTCRSQVNVKDFQRRFTMPAVMPASANILCPTANNNYMVQRSSVGRDVSWSVHSGVMRRKKVQDRKDLARPLYRKDIFYSGSIMYLPEFQNSKNDVRSYVASVTSIPITESSSEEKPSEEKSAKLCPPRIKLPKSMVDTLKEVLDFSLVKYPPFLLACIANVFGMMGFYTPFVYLTDSSVMKGIEKERAAFLISILGVTNLLGRLVFGWVVDRPGIRALDVNNLCLIVSGASTFVVPFCYSYTTIVAASSIFSFFVSAYISLTSIILVDMVGLDKLTNSFGLLSLFRGAAAIIGPPLAGSVFDYTQSYNVPFFMAGSLLIMSAICTLFVPWVTNCTRIKEAALMAQKTEETPHRTTVYRESSDADSGRPESIAIAEVVTAL